jgi:hypothetical protein
MQRPSIGRIVIVRAAPAQNNGAAEAPAIITRVWGDSPAPDGAWCVNLRVLLDGSDATPAKTSVVLYPDQAAADAAKPTLTDTHVAWWPPQF